jgi:hypothetical protein
MPAYGNTTSSEITTGRPAVTGVGDPPIGIPSLTIGIPPMLAPIPAPAHGSQQGLAWAQGAPWPQGRIGGPAIGAGAPGGVNPGGR